MKCTLTTSEKLKDLRSRHGLSLEHLAEKTGISSSSLGNYESDTEPDIGSKNLKILCSFYNVSADYLLGLTDNENLEKGDFSELNVDDATLDILKTGKFNHRLLCEILKHPALEKFLADIEIYVDGVATMNVNAFNSLVDFARQEILEKYHPDDNDYHMRVLNASTIDEYQYFLQLIQSDLGKIIKDIKQAHVGEPDSAPKESIIESFKKTIEACKAYEGTPIEKEFYVLCNSCKINVSKVPDVEKAHVINFIKRSPKFRPRIR